MSLVIGGNSNAVVVMMICCVNGSIGLLLHRLFRQVVPMCKKGKVFPYSLPSVGPGADPGVQAVSPQVT